MIPFLNLHKINHRYKKEFTERFQKFLENGYYILGDQVQLFEKEFAKYCGVSHCIGVGNGLDALRLILEGYKIKGELNKGDGVLVASNTFIATIIAIKQAGLTPVLVEVNPNTYNFDIDSLEKAITEKTKAVMPVHLYGRLAPIKSIKVLAEEHKLLLIEDAAQAHGAKNKRGIRAGNLGNAAGFSFYPSKNLGALGDGGAITTNDEALATIVRKLRNYGTSTKYVNEYLGVNSRLDEIQALFLRCKLPSLDSDNEDRRMVAKRYLEEIDNEKVLLPNYDYSEKHVFHLFVVRVENRDHFIDYMNKNKIGTLIHYPVPPHKQDALPEFNSLYFPASETIHEQVVSLPISPVISFDDVTKVIQVINNY